MIYATKNTEVLFSEPWRQFWVVNSAKEFHETYKSREQRDFRVIKFNMEESLSQPPPIHQIIIGESISCLAVT